MTKLFKKIAITSFVITIAIVFIFQITNVDAAQTFATWNSADKSPNITLSGSDLTADDDAAGWDSVRSTISKSSGKHYWEITIGEGGVNRDMFIGIAQSGVGLESAPADATNDTVFAYYGFNGQSTNGGSDLQAYGDSYDDGNVVGIAVDYDAGKIWFSKNDTFQNSGNPAAGTGEAYSSVSGTFFAFWGSNGSAHQITANFGATAFAGTVPSGFAAGLFTGEAGVAEEVSNSQGYLIGF